MRQMSRKKTTKRNNEKRERKEGLSPHSPPLSHCTVVRGLMFPSIK